MASIILQQNGEIFGVVSFGKQLVNLSDEKTVLPSKKQFVLPGIRN